MLQRGEGIVGTHHACGWCHVAVHSLVSLGLHLFIVRGPRLFGDEGAMRAEVGARRHRSCVLRWALIVAVRACWCGAHVAVHPLVSLGLHLFVVLGPRLFRDEGTVRAC